MLILASNSPRRRRLITLGGWAFAVAAAPVDETAYPGESPTDYVLRLAKAKALAAARLTLPGVADNGSLIVAADTTVADGPDILGKPESAAQAIAMLERLRGRVHWGYTAIAVLRPLDGRLETDICATEVPMRPYSQAELHAYVASGDPMDKAGAYAIQHTGFHPVESLAGCYANVVGLPLCHLARTLRRFEQPYAEDLPARCQAELGYACPVYAAILESSS